MPEPPEPCERAGVTADPVTVPLVVEPDPDDRAAATLLVSGAAAGRAYRFVLDSGTATTRLPYDASTAGLPRTGRRRERPLAGTADVDLVGPVDVSAGAVTVRGLTVARCGPDHPAPVPLLGRDVLDRYACRLDVAAGTLDLAPSGTWSAALPLVPGRRGHWYVDVTWPASATPAARACWDSGAGVTLVDRDLTAAHPDRFVRDGTTSTGSDAAGAAVAGTVHTMRGAVLGGVAPRHRLSRDHEAFSVLWHGESFMITCWGGPGTRRGAPRR